MGTLNFFTRKALLEANGWRVEWQRVQFGIDTGAGSGYWYLGEKCVGVAP